MNKDLAESSIEPGGPTTFFSPAGKPAGSDRPDDSTRPGKP
jgi:hypothetical protein